MEMQFCCVFFNRYSDELRDGRPGLESRQRKVSFLLHSFLTGSGAHPASYPMGTGVLYEELKRPGREGDH
jgi:hypothetical protein